MNFLRELKYTAISMLSTVEGMFWTVAYPIILSSLFFVIFSAINTQGISAAITTGVAETNPNRGIFNSIPILHVIPMEQEAADAALREGRIQAFIADDLSIRIYKNGIFTTESFKQEAFSAISPKESCTYSSTQAKISLLRLKIQ